MRYDPDRECSKMVQRLRKICAAKGISVYAAARKAHISVSTLNELLNEKTRPQLYTLYKICNALDIHLLRKNDIAFEKTIDHVSSIRLENTLLYCWL